MQCAQAFVLPVIAGEERATGVQSRSRQVAALVADAIEG